MRLKTIIIAATAVLCLPAGAQMGAAQKSELEVAKSMEVMLSIFRDVNLFYVDTLKPDKMVRDAMSGMLKKLDPYTEYFPEEDMSDFEFAVTGKYGGVGALIRQRGEWVEISEPYEGTPSAQVGLKAGDRLLEIDGTNLRNAGSSKVSSMLKGDPETKFTLKYRPLTDTTTTKTVEITRKKIVIPGVPYYGVIQDSVGYIQLNNFTEGCSKEVKDAFEKLKSKNNIKSLILDLRGNGGGIVGEAIEIISMFVPKDLEALNIKGKIKEMNSTYRTRHLPIDLEIPIAVLVNSGSASASEIIAGAMQDLDRAIIVGQRSFGKGLVQAPRQMPYNGLLKLTTGKYYTPSGRCIQALDYTHRKDDGSVGHIPDSIIREFTTKNGRKVYDGGGIMPDIKIDAEYMSKFGVLLEAYGFIDDFANHYASYNTPVESGFKVDDKIYDQFVDFMSDKTIEYESLSSVKLKELRDAAKREKYDERIVAELDAIAEKIKDDKNAELQQYKDELKEYIENKILTRWFFSRAAIKNSLNDDKATAKAIEILTNTAEYERILKEQDTTKN